MRLKNKKTPSQPDSALFPSAPYEVGEGQLSALGSRGESCLFSPNSTARGILHRARLAGGSGQPWLPWQPRRALPGWHRHGHRHPPHRPHPPAPAHSLHQPPSQRLRPPSPFILFLISRLKASRRRPVHPYRVPLNYGHAESTGLLERAAPSCVKRRSEII